MRNFWIFIISLFMGLVIGFGVWHGIEHKSEIKDFGEKSWESIKSVFVKKDGNEQNPGENPEEPTPEDPDGPYVHVHEYGEWKITFSPTCVEAGTETRTCACGYFEEREIAATGHNFGEWQTTTAPTCTTDGVKTKTCANCTESQTETLPATGHTFGEWQTITASTCTTDGVKVKSCANCTEIQSENIPATGHGFGDWTTTKAPTCVEAGTETRTCACGYFEEREIAATGHTYGEWEITTEATCASSGSMKRTCEICSVVETKSITKLAHTYEQDGSGVKIYHLRFSKGNAVLRKIYFDDGTTQTIMTSRTCNDCGLNVICPHRHMNLKHCMSCDKWETLESEKHVWETSLTQITKQPTCLETGTRTKTCHYCGYVLTEEIPALGHSFGDWETTAEATCTTDGVRTKTCANCSESQTETFEALGHNYVNGTCSRCGGADPDYVAECKHLNEERVTVEEPTCDEEGLDNIICADCGEFLWQESVEELGHDNITDETYFSECSRCGHEHDFSCGSCSCGYRREKLGHYYTLTHPDIIVSATTCTEEGVYKYKCTNCTYILEGKSPALGHDCVDGVCSRCGESNPEEVPVSSNYVLPVITIADHTLTLSYEGSVSGLYYRESGNENWTWYYVNNETTTFDLTTLVTGDQPKLEKDKTYFFCFTVIKGRDLISNAVSYNYNEVFNKNFYGYWFSETTGFDVGEFSKYYFLIEKNGDSYCFTRSGYKVEDDKIILYNNPTDYGSLQTFTYTPTNGIIEFTLTRQGSTFTCSYDGQQVIVGNMTFVKTDKEIFYDGKSMPITPM